MTIVHVNGTVHDFGKGGDAIPHLLRMLPEGLNADALAVVSKPGSTEPI